MRCDTVLVSFSLCLLFDFVWSHRVSNPLSGQGQGSHGHKPAGGNPRPPSGHGGHARTGGHQGGPPNVMDRNAVHDQEHIMEHLDGKVDTKEKYSEEELQFHYFKIHDYDDNNMLDGLEIISALTHRHREDEPMDDAGITDGTVIAIDFLLNTVDLDRDGFISYSEYARNLRSSMTPGAGTRSDL